MDSVKQEVFNRMPEGTKPVLSQGYHILSPSASWRKYRRREQTRKQVAQRFFGSWETFKGFEREFFDESGIVRIVMSGLEEIGDEKVVFDTHMGVCARVYSLIRVQKPDVVVSTGVYSGVGTCSILLALHHNGHGTLYSVDGTSQPAEQDQSVSHEDDSKLLQFIERGRPSCSEHKSHTLPAGREPGWMVPEYLHDRWEFRRGDSQTILPELFTELSEIDMFYHDSAHSTGRMLFEFELAWEWLKPGGMLISPHIDHNDAFDIFVDERNCIEGLLEFDYLAYSEYDTPCSCGYAVKPLRRSENSTQNGTDDDTKRVTNSEP